MTVDGPAHAEANREPSKRPYLDPGV